MSHALNIISYEKISAGGARIQINKNKSGLLFTVYVTSCFLNGYCGSGSALAVIPGILIPCISREKKQAYNSEMYTLDSS